MPAVDLTKTYTLPEMADALKVPWYRVKYIVRSRGFTEVRRVGNVRLFDERVLSAVRRELREYRNHSEAMLREFDRVAKAECDPEPTKGESPTDNKDAE